MDIFSVVSVSSACPVGALHRTGVRDSVLRSFSNFEIVFAGDELAVAEGLQKIEQL